PIQERNRSRRLLGIVLGALLAVSAVLVVLGIAQIVAWWVPVFAVVGLGAYLVGLRRAEIERRARVTRAATREGREPGEAWSAGLRAREGTAPAQSGGEGPAARGQAPRSDLETGSRRAAEQVSRPGEWTPRPVPRPTYALRGEVEVLATRYAAH